MAAAQATLGDRLAGAVWGHLVGDAIGVPYEFGSRSDPSKVKFGAQGAHGQTIDAFGQAIRRSCRDSQ